jgi:site-specific DNA-adenine methylase
MFSYYGSKSKLIKYYPQPIFDTIIEPFAGSAQYSFNYWWKNIILIEKDKRTANVWKYLIDEATPDQILALPLFEKGEKIIHSNPAIRDLIALESNRGSAGTPRLTPQNRSRWTDGGRERIAANLYKIKNWKIIEGNYTLAPDIEATYFIDPPYNNKAGRQYHTKFFDYEKLAKWCTSRNGQVIVCENEGADWLPFRFLRSFHGNKYIRNEMIWTNNERKTLI